MYRDKKRFGQDPAKVIRSAAATFNAPLRWKEPARVFVCSWSDFFIEDADPWREEAWEIMRKTPHLTYQILTKRPENISGRLPAAYECFGGGWPLPNVWLGVTAENQEMADLRIPILLRTPATVRFVSIEPMVGEISLTSIGHTASPGFVGDCLDWYHRPHENRHDKWPGIEWVIVGAETGPNAREMKPEWAEQLLIECDFAGTPFFMKQMTNKAPIPERLNVRQFPQP
jgi:protein gp37